MKPSQFEWDEVFLAGQRVLPGRYRDLETGRVIELNQEETLPASLDGRVASYTRTPPTWSQVAAPATFPEQEAANALMHLSWLATKAI